MRWKRGRLLGKGAYGKVWEGLMDSAKLIAVKEVELDPECPEKAQSQYEKIQLEVEILRSLRHRNIVSYLGTSLQYGTVYIFMDFISGGSLQSILKRFGPLDERTVSHYTRQTCRGLLYIHSNAIIHRDIKGANIMVTSRGVVKLIDFGCAKKYCQEMSNNMHSVRGTPYWMAPEVICGHGYGRKSDIWSLGCTVHEMALTKPPWADFPPEAAMFQIGIGKAVPPPPDHLSPTIREFFYSCLTRDPGERPSAAQLLEHRFLAMATPSRRPSDT